MSEAAGLYDADGRPVTPDMRPPDVTALPMFAQEIKGTPSGVEVRYLGGNWYGDGPCAVLWHPKRRRHVVVPVSKLDQFCVAVRMLTGKQAAT